MSAKSVDVRVSKRFLYQGFVYRSINGLSIHSPYVPSISPCLIPYDNRSPCIGLSLLFFFQLWLQNQTISGLSLKGLKILNLGFAPTVFFFFFATINARSIGTYQ
jgi:hypothetical protein